MSWQLASFLLLALALGGGFAWYERSHPSARVLALVGTLAALAVLGRIAFAPVPNVKPTTDLVLLSGYVFGGAPGLRRRRGRRARVELLLHAGPVDAVADAGVGRGRRRAARGSRGSAADGSGALPLAVACGLSGLAFGVDRELRQRRDVRRRRPRPSLPRLPGDLAAVGPRARARQRRLLPAVRAGAGAHAAALPHAPRVHLATARPAGARGRRSRPLLAAGLAAHAPITPRSDAGRPAGGRLPRARAERRRRLRRRARPPLGRPLHRLDDPRARGAGPRSRARPPGRPQRDRLRPRARPSAHPRRQRHRHRRPRAHDPRAARRPASRRARSPASDLVAALAARVGRRGHGAAARSTSPLSRSSRCARAAIKADRPSLRRAGAWLARQQNDDGGFGFLGGGVASDVDDTAAVDAGACVAGRARAALLQRAVGYVRGTQNADGGLPQQLGGTSNAQSTAWAIQGLLAAGVRPESVRRDGGASPLAYLRSLVGPDGAVRYSRSSIQTPVWVTAYAALALARRPLPLAPPVRA